MKTFAVTSGKGGVGKTNFAANLGIALTQQNRRTIVFDADLGLANLDIILGIKPEFTLQHVLAGQHRVADVLCQGPGGIQIVAGGSAIASLMRVGPKRMEVFFTQVAELRFVTDILLFDTGAGIDSKVMGFVKAADEVILITTPDPASVTDAYATIKTIFKNRDDARINVVANQVSDGAQARTVYDMLARVAQEFLGKPLIYCGFVRMDAAVRDAVRARKPFLLADPNSPASEDIRMLAARFGASAEGGADDLGERLQSAFNVMEDVA